MKENSHDELITQSVNDFVNRPIHKVLTKDILATIKDEDVEQAIFDNITQRIGGLKGTELENVSTLSVGQQALYSTWMTEGVVLNGGFNQFYFNSSGAFSKMAVKGFETFGLGEYVTLMQKANTMYDSIRNDLAKFNDGTKEGFSKSYENNPLNSLDEEFYTLQATNDMNKSRIKYIRLHPEEFIQG